MARNPVHASPSKLLWLAVLTLITLSFATFLGQSDRTTLRGIDSNIHAAASMEVTAHGFLPHLPIRLQGDGPQAQKKIFNDHPFTLFWLNGWIMRALGPSAFSARILTASFAVGCVLLVLALGTLEQGAVFGVIAALFALFTRDFILTSATVSLDTALVFFILLSFWFWRKKNWTAVGISAGIGLWFKTPVVLLIFPTALLTAVFIERLESPKTWKRTLRQIIQAAFTALLLGSCVWILTGLLGGWDLVRDYWIRQLWGTAIEGRGAGGFSPGFWLYTIRTGFLPGLPFFLFALFKLTRENRWQHEPLALFSALAVLILSVVVTSMRFKLGHYYTPVFPFLALISAYACADFLRPRAELFYATVIALGLVTLGLLVATPLSLAPEGFVALRKFVPFIIKYAECSDRILLVEGGEPVGSALDARLFLNFYTGRAVDTVSCQQLPGQLAQTTPHWIILSRENHARCLDSVMTQKSFPTRIQVGNQILLSRSLSLKEGMIDLTPLHLELQAVRDCQAPSYPQDLWHRY